MATRAPHACPKVGCANLAYKPGPCENCAKARDQARGSAASRGYDNKHRKQFRAVVLKRVLCQDPDRRHPGHKAVAKVADHIIPLSQGGSTDPDTNGMALCVSCHNYKTATRDGGFGRMRASA